MDFYIHNQMQHVSTHQGRQQASTKHIERIQIHGQKLDRIIAFLFIQVNAQRDCSRNVKTYIKIYIKMLLLV